MAIHHCSIEVQKTLQDMGVEEMDELRREINRRQRVRMLKNEGESADQALVNAAGEIVEEQKAAARIAKRNAYLNLQRRTELASYLQREFSDDPGKGVQAILAGVNRDTDSSRLSVNGEQNSLMHYYVGRFLADVMKLDLFDDFVRGVYDKDIADALWRFGQDTPDMKGLSSEAVSLAEVVRKWQDISRIDANRVGAFIGNDPGYISRQTHDMFKLRRKGFQRWREVVEPRLDMARMEKIVGDEDWETLIRSVYDATSSGVHLTNAAPGEHASVPDGLRSIAKRMSKERLLHFKNGVSWFEYNQEFGIAPRMAETVVRHLEYSAKQTGLMRVLGPNAENNLAILIDYGKRLGARAGKRVDFTESVMKIYRNLDGSTRVTGNATFAMVSASARAIQSMSKLGGATLSAIADIPFFASELKFQGVGFLERWGEALRAPLKGRGSAEQFELASMLGVAMDTWRGSVVARFHSEDNLPGTLSNLQGLFFRFNALSYWTDSLRSAAATAMSRRLAINHGADWSGLGEDLQRTLRLFGVNEAEWKVAKGVDLVEVEGDSFFVPESFRTADVDSLLETQFRDIDERHAEVIRKADEADARDLQTIENQVNKFQAVNKQAKTVLADARKRTTAKQAALREIIDREVARLDQAEVLADIESFVAAERVRDRQRRFLERVEEGADLEKSTSEGKIPSIVELSNRELDRFSKTHGARGEKLGRKQARTEARIAELDKRIAAHGKQFTDTENQVVARIQKAMTDVVDYTTRAQDRLHARSARLAEFEKVVEGRKNRLRNIKRDELERKFLQYFQDRTDYAVVNPDARANAIMNQGLARGTVAGEFFNFIMQFKSFPLAVLFRPVGRELYGRSATGNVNAKGVWSLAQLITVNTAFGYLAMSAKDLSRGRQPRDPNDTRTWRAALLQGGGLGIYGDFLFGELKSRFGQGPLETLLGPSAGSLSDVIKLYQATRDGDPKAVKSFNLALNHAPFLNLFYLRMALDYAILHRIREGMNPGYLDRMQRNIERENDQRLLFNPRQGFGPFPPIPRGGGAVGELAGSIAVIIDRED